MLNPVTNQVVLSSKKHWDQGPKNKEERQLKTHEAIFTNKRSAEREIQKHNPPNLEKMRNQPRPASLDSKEWDKGQQEHRTKTIYDTGSHKSEQK